MINRFKFIFVALLAVLVLTGCRTTHHVAYGGPARAASETATIEGMNIGGQYNWAAARVERIGHKAITADPFAKQEIIHILPGMQTVYVVVATAYQERKGAFEFELLAGHAYQVRIVVDETEIPKGKLVLKSAELFDLTEQRQVRVLTAWSPVKNTPQGPTTIYIQMPSIQ